MNYAHLIRQHPLKFILSLFISAILVYLAFKDLDWPAFIHALQDIDYWILLAGAVVLIGSNVVRAFRWKILLGSQGQIRARHLFEATMIGYMGSNVLPFKLGEVLRAVVVSKRHQLSVSGVGASILVERSLDIVSFLIIAGIYGVLVPSFESARILAGLGLAALLGMLIFSFWMNRNHDAVLSKVHAWADRSRSSGRSSRAEHILSMFKGFESLWRMPQPVTMILQTFSLWALYLGVTLLAFKTFDFGLSWVESLHVAFVLLLFSTLSLSIPASPGYVGTYHYAVISALKLFDIVGDQALAFAVVLHLMNFLIYTPTGAFYLIKAGLSLDLATEEIDAS